MEFFGLSAGVAVCFGIGALFVQIFWIWMLIEAAVKEPSEGTDKIVWVIVILLMNFIGALIYFLVRRPQRIRTVGE